MTKRRPISQLPSIHRTAALERFFGATVDHLFQPGKAEPLSGFIGRVPPYNNVETDFYKQEPTASRTRFQLEAAMVSLQTDGSYGDILFYEDLIARLSNSGALVNDENRLFKSEYWSWAPPVDIDKINNFQQYYWSGADVPALELTLPGMELPTVHVSRARQRRFAMGPSLPCMRILEEDQIVVDDEVQDYAPIVIVNGTRTTEYVIDGEDIVLDTAPLRNQTVEIYRYGNVSDGLRTDYPIPDLFNPELPFDLDTDVHVYIRGRETFDFTIVDSTRIRLDTPAPENNIVTVTVFDSIERLCTGRPSFNIEKLNRFNVPEMINGLKVKLIDPWVYFLGFDIKPYDTFKWDERRPSVFYVDGVGVSIYLTDASILAGLEAQYVVISRADRAVSYYSRINRWVTEEALAWFNGKTFSRQAKRPICEFIPNLRLWNYGRTRAPDADCIFGVVSEFNLPVDLSVRPFLDDTGRAASTGDVVLFGDIGDPEYNNKFFRWPIIDGSTETVELEFITDAREHDVVRYTASRDEYRFEGGAWLLCQKPDQFPLFDLFDNDGYSLGDEGIYPNSNFAGSRIFNYKLGTGDSDPRLGFPVEHDTYGQIIFENYLYTERYNYRDGEMQGYYYYCADDVFGNQWYKATSDLPAVGNEVIVPLNLQANPNFGTPDFISRNNWFTHFASIIENQVDFDGKPFSKNNWSVTQKDLSVGTHIIQSRAPLLKLMLIMGENGFDLPQAIKFAETEYVRLKLKIREKIRQGLNAGLITQNSNFRSELITILSNLAANKTADFAYFLSEIGDGQYFIPPTPSTLGITPLIKPALIEENGDLYIRGHDGSLYASSDEVTDAIMMEFENLIYDSRIDFCPKEFEFPLLNEYDLFSGKFRNSDYSSVEATAIFQASFEDWARVNNIDYQTNTTYDEENPFTWNYGSLGDADGEAIAGNWRGIYRYYFDTEMPHITPWEMLGFKEEPQWWRSRYGQAPYTNTNIMWEDLEAGFVAEGPRAGFDERFARPGLRNILPVDSSGNLLNPVEARIVDQSPPVQFAKENWIFGDGSPVETLWRRSSSFNFAKALVMFLMRPAQFVEYYWDTDNRILVHEDQWVDTHTNDRAPHSKLIIHGEGEEGARKRSYGIQNWMVEHMIHNGRAPEILGNLVRGLDVRLAHKMAGFTTPDRMMVSTESFGLIPSEDVAIELYQSPSLSIDVYSGVIIEYLNASRWRVIGYNPTDPYFTIRPCDRGGRRKALNSFDDDERVINPWAPNIFYKTGMYVSYQDRVYEANTPHLSSQVFEQSFWNPESKGQSLEEKLYQYVDGDGTVARVPYTTVMVSRQEVIDFLFGYQRDLEERGFRFPAQSWFEAAQKFINWSNVEWASGSFLTLSPAARILEYDTPHGYVMNLEDTQVSTGIVSRSGHVIDSRLTSVDRFDNSLVITATGEDDMYGAAMRKAEVEHVIIFSNRTIFGDIIYDPVFNIRQDRLKISARRTTEWVGRREAPGFMVTNNGIIDNFDKSAEDLRYMFDIEKADNSILRDHARHVIGFEKRQYLSNLLLNDTQQFELYQGMIQQKGALGALDKIMRSRAVEGSREVKYLEEWAFKIAEFGANEPRGYLELNLKQDDLNRQTQIIRLDEPLVNSWLSQTPYEVGNFVRHNDLIYVCRTNHLATTFQTDLELGYWVADATQQASAQNAILSIRPADGRWVSDPIHFEELVIDPSRKQVNPDNAFVEAWSEGSYEINSFARFNGFVYVANRQTTPDAFIQSEWNIVLDEDLGVYGLPNAGYVRTGEAKFAVPSFEHFQKQAANYIRSGNSFAPRDSVWIYSKENDRWGIEYLDYPTDAISAENLLYEDFGNSRWVSSSSLVTGSFTPFVAANNATPKVFSKKPRFVYYADSAEAPASSIFTAQAIGVLANNLYNISVDVYTTEGFNGRVSLIAHWLKDDGTVSDTPRNTVSIDYTASSSQRGTERILDQLLLVPSDAATTIIQIEVIYQDNPQGRAYIANPEMFYAGDGLTITSVVTAQVNSDVIGTRFNLSLPHNFTIGDYVLIGGPIVSNFEATGIFQIANVGEDWFEIDDIREALSYDFEEMEEVGPPVYSLKAGRFANLIDAQNAMAGQLAFVDDVGDGRWAVFRAPNFTDTVRSQPNIIDNTKVASGLVYDQQTIVGETSLSPEPVTLARINPVDTTLGLIVGAADREIDFKLEYDPANYDDVNGRWTDNYVGRVWWDTSTVWFINPYTDVLDESNPDQYSTELRYRAQNWAKLATGSEVNLYEWTKSFVLPSDEDQRFVAAVEYNPDLGREVTVYYYWIKNPREVPNVEFRKLDCQSCANIISNPSLAGIPWMALISEKDFVVSGLSDSLNDKSTVLQIQLQLIEWDEETPHTQWLLMRPEDRRSRVPSGLLRKLRDSLVGFDDNLRPVPSMSLHPENRVGVGKGQSMIHASKRKLARESFITMLNYQLARRNFGSDQNFGDEKLTFDAPIPQKMSWSRQIGENNILIIPPSVFYDEVTTDPSRLEQIANDALIDNYRVLVDNRFGDNPSWSVWHKLNGEISLANAYDIEVETRAERNLLDVPTGTRVLVREDRDFENLWTVSRRTEDGWVIDWAQSFRTSDFWDRADWFAEGFDADNPPVVTYPTLTARNQAEIPVVNNTFVRILDNGAGYWIWTVFRDGIWEVVAQQLGTVQFSDRFYRGTEAYASDNIFDNNSVRLRDGSQELRVLFDALFARQSTILNDQEKNELWFSMINFIHANHDMVDWAFKTSFMSIVGFNETLTAAPVTSPDTSADIMRYIEEVKPYHVTIRDFARSFTPDIELAAMVVTDFDQPMYFDVQRQIYRKLDPRIPADRAIMEQGQWRHSLAFPDKVRDFRTTIKFDRIWFTDTDDSGAARRIMSFYRPREDMAPLNLRQLLDLDFKGTILDGTDFGSELDETNTALQINGQDSDERGYQMRDPRVAPDTPEELVRLGGHDVFLLRARDKWGAGGPLGTINQYDVSKETDDTVSLRIDALARDVVVFVDGIRLSVEDYLFNQLGNLVENIPLEYNGNRVKTVTIHAFGYAAHQTILEQIVDVAAATTVVFSIPNNILSSGDAFSFEATLNGISFAAVSRVGDTVEVTCDIGDQIVLTFFKTDNVDSTNIVINEFTMLENPVSTAGITNQVGLGTAGSFERDNWYIDLYSRRQFVGSENGGLRINNIDTGASIRAINSSNFRLKAVIEGSDLFVTQDNSTPTTVNPRFRSIGIRLVNDPSAPIVLIGTNGEFTGAPSMTPTRIPEDVTIFDISNPLSDRRAILIARQGQSSFFDVKGKLLKEGGDIGWGADSFLIKTANMVDRIEALLFNPSSNSKPIVKIVIESNMEVIVSDFALTDLITLGALNIRAASYDKSDNSLILWVVRNSDTVAGVVKYSLQNDYVVWSTWSDTSPFGLPQSMIHSSVLNDARHVVWATNLGIHDLDPRSGVVTNIESTTGIANNEIQHWEEETGNLFIARSQSDDLRRFTIEFVDTARRATFDLTETSLVRPFNSSMIVEVDGKRLSPPRMIHLVRMTEYPVGDNYDPASIRIIDDLGVVQPVRIFEDDAFASLDDIPSAGLPDRYVFWKNVVVLLDSNAGSRTYTLFISGSGDYNIREDSNQLIVNRLRFGQTVRVQHWRNDAIMQPTTWSFKPRKSGIYRINTKSRPGTSWVTRGGLRLVEGIDYAVIPTALGAWDIESYDTFRYDNRIDVDIVIKNTVHGDEHKDIVITTFEGVQAIPAQEWQLATTTPSIYRFQPRPEDETGRPLVREPRAWELTVHDLFREGGRLEGDIPQSITINEIVISENPLNSPAIIQAPSPIPVPDGNIPGVIWIGPERIEYFKMDRTNGIIRLNQIRRGTRGTPTVSHTSGDLVRVQNNKRIVPRLPQGDLPIPTIR